MIVVAVLVCIYIDRKNRKKREVGRRGDIRVGGGETFKGLRRVNIQRRKLYVYICYLFAFKKRRGSNGC